MARSLTVFGKTYNGVTGIKAYGINEDLVQYKAQDDNLIFIDYDGTVLDSYSTADALALTSLPSNPTHTGLTSQGWNWTLAQIKSYLTSYPKATVVVGQMYITTSGATEIEINLDDPDYLSPYLILCVNNGNVEIDWGDGTSTDTLWGPSIGTSKYINHTYSSIGKYIIKIMSVDNITYTFSNNSNTLCGILTTEMPVINNDRKRNRTYNSKIISIKIGNNYTNYINSNSFSNCISLEYITIPSGITTFYTSIFNNCFSLKSITIPSGVTRIPGSTFDYCCLLNFVAIPNSITSIVSYAFRYCYSLKYVTIPNGLTSIDNSAFQNCYSLKSIIIPTTITSVGNNVFQYCRSLEFIVISSGLTSISTNMFNSCYYVKSISIPSSVTSIGKYAFQYGYYIENIIIPNTVTSIGEGAFSGCNSLKSVTIPSSITSIDKYAFQYCYYLESIIIPNTVTSIGYGAFANCQKLESIEIPNSVTSIGEYAFSDCYSLISVNIPSGVTSIEGSTFNGCASLESIIIPNTVTRIGGNAFYNCYSLKSVTIPSSVTYIGSAAFSSCYGVTEYHILPETPPTAAGSIFSSIISDTIIYVPYSADHSILEAYKTATNWSKVASKMQEEPQS